MITYAILEADGADDFIWHEIESGELESVEDAVAWLGPMERGEKRLEERADDGVSAHESAS